MAIKFQYNKTSLQQLEKQLKVRVRTLPISCRAGGTTGSANLLIRAHACPLE